MTFLRPFRAVLASACTLAALSAIAGEDYPYTVQRGETLIGISNDLLTHPQQWRKLQAINHVADPYRLMPGTTLRIPVDLLRLEPTSARVTATRGEVRANGNVLKTGDTISGETQIVTGPQSFTTIELIDGSHLVLQPESRIKVEALARRRGTTLPETQLRLEGGRVESIITKSAAPRPKYIIHTPTASIGVRGTSFRVGADDSSGTSRTEVTDGTVGVNSGSSTPTAVAAGFGVVADTGGKVSEPAALLSQPQLGDVPQLHERIVVRLSIPPLPGAQSYRFQIGADAGMNTLLADTSSPKPEAKFGELPDGEYTLRVRGVDAQGLEGLDADLRFKLKARPEPPFTTAPTSNAKLRAESVALAWTSNPDAARYRVQLANDLTFTQLVADIDNIDGTTILPAQKLPPGDYFWRTRSIRTDGDLGPWGDPQRFLLRPLPANPEPPKISDHELTFAWSGEPGQTFLFQFARDADFADIITEQQRDEPTATLARPEAGTYYMRVRATDADGFVGPFTHTQLVAVPNPAPPWWLPLLILLPLGI